MQNADIFHPPLPATAEETIFWHNLQGASVGLALHQAMQASKRPWLIITPDSLYASHLLDELHFFGGEQQTILEFPDWETLPYDHFSPHQDIISERLSTLSRAATLSQGAIISTLSTLLHKLSPTQFLDAHGFLLATGDKLNLEALRTRLTKAGYYAVSQVKEHGEFAIRGSIIDLFPMGSKTPYRIDLFDDEIDSIRLFSTESQRSLEKIDKIQLLPAKEFPMTEESIEHFRHAWREQFPGNPMKCPTYQDVSEGISAAGLEYYLPLFFDETASIFDYLPSNTVIVMIENIEDKTADYWKEIQLRYEQGRHDVTRPLLAPTQLFFTADELKSYLKKHARIQLGEGANKRMYTFDTSAAPMMPINHKVEKPLAALEEFNQSFAGRILFCAESMGRREAMLPLLNSIQMHPHLFHDWQAFLESNERIGLAVTPIENGFCLKDPALAIITETQLYGQRVMQRRLRKRTAQNPDAIIRDLTELKIDDAVVHIDHGIGRYRGLQTLTVGDQVGEFLTLEYQNNDILYVPVASLHLISRYTGANPDNIPIHKLGTDHWNRAKQRAAEKVRDVAAELLELYAKRAAKPGIVYQLDQGQYAIFADAFPFEETPDQQQAIENIFNDMTSVKSMDRVICGDVGFGKTEVAMRAAFLAVQNNKQVAILAPTTLLAQQHAQNFQDRFADWPIQIESLSRFKTKKEQEIVLNKLMEGKIDIVIGTHKLLQPDVKFKSLGLVVVDEEHRFGVKQKEKLKSFCTHADILSLTATPIPRTLNMALAGIRDLSIIATPPKRRLSVKTFVHEYQNQLVQEAIQREIMRGGQVYFLHNDIATIEKKANEISKLVPEARPVIAHGQMHERELERVMTAFYHRQYNVLVCSTIIESGIDIPTANTIIINDADHFGIAQLHQLRGRVGRSHHQAYAYLLIPSKQTISRDAQKRLDAISAFDDLGIGFTLSTHDLEIRGAGALLGEEQSGNMHEVGFTLYMDLLSRAVEALKSGEIPDQDETLLFHGAEVDLRITALIPEDYLNDVGLRLEFYKRIANAKTQAALDEIQVEMIDRFGLLPDPLKNLIAVTELKQKANTLGIIKIEAHAKGAKVEFTSKPQVKPETIIRLIQTQYHRYRLEGPTTLKVILDEHDKASRITLIEQILKELAE